MTVETQLATLAPAAREWAESIRTEYDLSPTGKALLVEAARALDIIEEARSTRRELVASGRYQNSERVSPWLTAERQARQDFLRCVLSLNLDQGEK